MKLKVLYIITVLSLITLDALLILMAKRTFLAGVSIGAVTIAIVLYAVVNLEDIIGKGEESNTGKETKNERHT